MSKPIRHIVFVSPYGHHGSHSGARNRVAAICEALMVDPTIKLTCLSPWAPPSGVRHIPFCLDGHVGRKLINVSQLSFRLALLNPDLVISESPLAPLSFGRYRLLHVIHDAKFTSPFARRGARIARNLHAISAAISDGVVTVSFSEKARLIETLGLRDDQLLVSYNGISNAWVNTPLPPSGRPRAFDLLYVSNFAPHKGHVELLQAMQGQNLRIAFVGTDHGALLQCMELAQQLEIDAVYKSNMSEDELIKVYDDSNAFVFPSKHEGFGIPYLEARARGLPVLANDLPVFHELQSQLGGSIVDFSNRSKAAELLKTLPLAQIDQCHLSHFKWTEVAARLVNSQK